MATNPPSAKQITRCFDPARAVLCLVVAWFMLSPAAAEEVWPLSAYRMSILVSTPDRPPWSRRSESELFELLPERLETWLGASCRIALAKPPIELERSMHRGLDRIDSRAGPHVASGEHDHRADDKVILLAVQKGGRGFTVEAREWDAATDRWGATYRRAAAGSRDVVHAATSVVLAAFGSLASIERIEGDRAELSIRAAELLPPEPQFKLIQVGDVLRLAIPDDGGASEANGAGDWSWLVVDSVDSAHASGRIYSRFQLPLAQSSLPGRLAVKVSPPDTPSWLELVAHGRDAQPAAGYEVWSLEPGKEIRRLLGRTGPAGTLALQRPARGESPLRILLVRHGGQTLARLPVVPGWQPRLTAHLTIDANWLRAAAATQTLGRRLLDLAARHEVELTRLQTRIADRKFDEAAQLLTQLREDGLLARFEASVENEQKRVFSSDQQVQDVISQMFDELLIAARKHFDAARLDALAAQLEAAKSVPAGQSP